jgi:CheY-like chemotaxis protein
MNSVMLRGNMSLLSNTKKQILNELNKNTVLFIDDDYVNFLYFRELLSEAAETVIRAVSLTQVIQKLTVNKNICAIVLSESLPENFNNIALRYLKAKFPNIPVISIMDDHNRNLETELLNAGAELCINRYTDHDHFGEVFFEVLSIPDHAR